MFIPCLSFTKYVTRMDLAFLTDYLGRLTDLHPNYQGLVLPGDTQPKPVEEAAEELLVLLNKETAAQKGFVGRHSVSTSASCGNFSWDITFERFIIEGSAFYGHKKPLPSREPHWIKQGVCNTIYDSGGLLSPKSDAWGVYLDLKESYKYEPQSHHNNGPLSYWGEYPEDRRTQVAEMLEALQPHVVSCHPELFTGGPFDPDTMTDCRTFVRYADDRLLRHFGEQGLNALLSVVDISLEQWLSAGEPKPANYSIGGILLPS